MAGAEVVVDPTSVKIDRLCANRCIRDGPNPFHPSQINYNSRRIRTAGDVDCHVDIHGGTDKFFFIALQNAQSYFLQVADASLNGRRFPYGLTCEFKCLAVRLEEMQGYGENAGNNYQRHPVAMTHIHTIFPDLERYVLGSCHVKHLAG
jgi:hypothetical protein